MKALLCVPLLLLAGCASTGSTQDPSDVDLTGAERAVRTEPNGDVIEEFRVAGQLRMVKVTPARGPAFFLIDDNGDGRADRSRGNSSILPVYWKLFGW